MVEKDMGVGEDRLSALPDSVLVHIISFLPTAEAVGTSILSKRWLWLWTSVPNLTFQYNPIISYYEENPDPEEARWFMNYVDRVLLHHHMSNIRKFELSCDETCDDFRVNSWISTVVKNRLEELDLFVSMKQTHVIPQSIYSCESLTKLNVETYGVLKQPTSFSLPNLKTLWLDSMIFTDECLTEKFFSSFPVLEELILSSCTWVNHKILPISVPSLKCLGMHWVGFGENRDLCDCAIKICAPNLENLFCSACKLPRDFILCDLSSLVHATYFSEESIPLLTEEEIWDSVRNLLNGLFNVKVLKIPADVVNVLPNREVEMHLPIFHNLIKLTLSTDCNTFEILCLLKLMPNLETLVYDHAYIDNEDELILDTVPRCLLSSLKKVQVEQYDRQFGESYLIEFLLKNALALERMAITYGIFMTEDPSEIMEDRKHISMIPKGSASCVIEFFDYPGSRENSEHSGTDDDEERADSPVFDPADLPSGSDDNGEHADVPIYDPADEPSDTDDDAEHANSPVYELFYPPSGTDDDEEQANLPISIYEPPDSPEYIPGD